MKKISDVKNKCRSVEAISSPNGKVHAVWLEKSGARERVVYSRKVKNHWNTPETISPKGSDNYLPGIVIDEKNKPLAYWSVKRGDEWAAVMSPIDESSIIRIDPGEGRCYQIKAVNYANKICFIWSVLCDGKWNLNARWYSRGKMGPIFSFGEGVVHFSCIADSKGRIHVVYDAEREGHYSLYYAKISGGRISDEVALSNYPGFETDPSLACDHDGNLWLAWVQWDIQFRDGAKQRFVNTIFNKRAMMVGRIINDRLCASPFRPPLAYFGEINHEEGQINPYQWQCHSPQICFDGCGRLYLFFRQIFQRFITSKLWRWDLMMMQLDGSEWTEPERLTLRYGQNEREPSALVPAKNSVDVIVQNEKTICELHVNGKSKPAKLDGWKPLISDSNAVKNLLHKSKVKPPKKHSVRGIGDVEYKLVFGDLHVHSEYSGCHRKSEATLYERFRYQSDIRHLDFSAVTDHSEMIDRYDWLRTKKMTAFFNKGGDFSTFPGYEWWGSNPKNGHFNSENVIIFSDEKSSCPPSKLSRVRHSRDLWKKLDRVFNNGGHFLAIPHLVHAMDWKNMSPKYQPLLEICQLGGTYEGEKVLLAHGEFARKQTAWYGLNQGHRFGFTGSGDHAGCSITGVYVREHSREGIMEALRHRRCYATTGAYIVLDVRTDDNHMPGEEFKRSGKVFSVDVIVGGTDKITSIDFIKNGEVIESVTPNKKNATVSFVDKINSGKASDYYYVRLTQSDGERAWSSPFFVENI